MTPKQEVFVLVVLPLQATAQLARRYCQSITDPQPLPLCYHYDSLSLVKLVMKLL